jgi:hypothetical protein
MDEEATFETRAVLAPRRARTVRLALLVPVVALVAVAWAGLSGAPSDRTTAVIPDPTSLDAEGLPSTGTTPPVTSSVEPPQRPAVAIGLDVRPLAEIRPQGLDEGEVVAIAGWYAPTAITDCPPLAAIYRDGALPYLRGDTDPLAFCVRSGVLYASRPEVDQGLPTNSPSVGGGGNSGGPSAVAATFVVGVIAPLELEKVGEDATEVVILGRFVEPDRGCRAANCPRVLLVDHVAWTPS